MFNSNYTSEQLESAIGKALADLKIEGATVNIQMVDENTPASGSVTKEDGSDRAKFDFKIPVPGNITRVADFNKIKELDFTGRKLFYVVDPCTGNPVGGPPECSSFTGDFFVEAIKGGTFNSLLMFFDGRNVDTDIPVRYIYEEGLNDSWFKLDYVLITQV